MNDEVAATCKACATLAKDRLVVLASDLILQGGDVESGELAWSYELKTLLDWKVKPTETATVTDDKRKLPD